MEENYLELSRKVFSTLTPREEKIYRVYNFSYFGQDNMDDMVGYLIEPKNLK